MAWNSDRIKQLWIVAAYSQHYDMAEKAGLELVNELSDTRHYGQLYEVLRDNSLSERVIETAKKYLINYEKNQIKSYEESEDYPALISFASDNSKTDEGRYAAGMSVISAYRICGGNTFGLKLMAANKDLPDAVREAAGRTAVKLYLEDSTSGAFYLKEMCLDPSFLEVVREYAGMAAIKAYLNDSHSGPIGLKSLAKDSNAPYSVRAAAERELINLAYQYTKDLKLGDVKNPLAGDGLTVRPTKKNSPNPPKQKKPIRLSR